MNKRPDGGANTPRRRARPKQPLVVLLVLDVGQNQNRDGRVGSVHLAYQLYSVLIGQGHIHYGCVYAAFGHPPPALGHRPDLRHHFKVWLPADQKGRRLPE